MPIKRRVVSCCLALVFLLALPGVWADSAGGLLWVPGSRATETGFRLRPVAITAGVKSVTAGFNFTFFLRTDDTLWVTGSSATGQLGIGNTTTQSTPVQVAADVASVYVTTYKAFFLKNDASLWGMGQNSSGSLGYTNVDGLPRVTPLQLATDVKAVAASSTHTLFLKNDGTVWAAGSNNYGQLGLNPATSPTLSQFTQVATDVASIAVQEEASFLVKTDGTLWVIGRNTSGRLGTGNTANISTPVQVAAQVASVAPGATHTLFIKSDDSLWAMGRNDLGQLGDCTTIDHLSPVLVTTGVNQVRTEGSTTFYLKNDHTLWGVGSNTQGRLGDGTTTSRSTPVQIATNVADVEASWLNTYFRKLDGSLWGVGDNVAGQLGDGTTTARATPQQIATGTSSFSVGSFFVMYLNPANELFGVGLAAGGELGDGTTFSDWVLLAPDVVSVEMGMGATWYVKTDGTLWSLFGGQVPGVTGATDVSVDDIDGWPVYRKADGTVLQLGADNVSTLIASDVAQVFSGCNYRLFLNNDGTLWGLNTVPPTGSAPVFGNGTQAALVATDVKSVSTASNYFLFVKSDHSLWGQGSIYPPSSWPNGSSPGTSALVHLETDVISASAHNLSTVCLKTDGRLWINSAGRGPSADSALLVAEEVAAGIAGYQFVYYIKNDGTLFSRSYQSGELGTATPIAGNVSRVAPATFEDYCFIQPPGGTPPVIEVDPISTTANRGTAVLLTVNASGPGPLDYQWYKDGVRLSHERKAALHIPYLTSTDVGSYTVKVTNRGGSATSATAAVALNKLPATVTLGNLSLVYDGTPRAVTVTTDPANLPVSVTYEGSSVPPTNPGSYAVVANIVHAGYIGSATGTLVILPNGPVIESNPVDQTVNEDGTATFTVTATGTEHTTYFWQRQYAGGTFWDYITGDPGVSGMRTATLTITNPPLWYQGSRFRCVLGDATGSVASGSALLTIRVTNPPQGLLMDSPTFSGPDGTASLGVTATGLDLSYQWYRNGSVLPGATTRYLTLTNVGPADYGEYFVTVSNSEGTVVSKNTTLDFRTSTPTERDWIDATVVDGVAYFLFADTPRIARYDLASETWLGIWTLATTPTAFAFSADAIYVASGNQLQRYGRDFSGPTVWATLSNPIQAVLAAESYIVTISGAGATNYFTSHRADTGTVVSSHSKIYGMTRGFSYSAPSGRIFGCSNGSPTDIHALQLLPDGTFANNMDSPYHGEFPGNARTFVVGNGTLVADDSGTIYRPTDLTFAGAFGGALSDIIAAGDGYWVLRGGVVSAYDSKFCETGRSRFASGATKLAVSGSNLFGFTNPATAGQLPGVEKLAQAEVQAPVPAPVVNPAGRQIWSPQVELAEDGTVLIYSKLDRNVFQWSPQQWNYLAGIPLSNSSDAFAHGNDGRVFFAERNNVRMTNMAGEEQPLYSTVNAVTALEGAESKLLVSHYRYSQHWPNLVLNFAGELLSGGPNFPGSIGLLSPTWSRSAGKAFSLRDGVIPIGLMSVAIAPDGSQQTQESNASWEITATAPIRVSPSGTHVLLGSGQIFDAVTLNRIGTLSNTIHDAAWAGGLLHTIRSTGESTELQSWSADTYQAVRTKTFSGRPVRLLDLLGDRLLLVTSENGELRFRMIAADQGEIDPAGVIAPEIIVAPVFSSPDHNGDFSFTVTTRGGPVPTYQWQVLPAGQAVWQNLLDNDDVEGARTGRLAVRNIVTAFPGAQFRAQVTNSAGTVTTGPTAPALTAATFALSATTFVYNGSPQGPSIVATPADATFTTGGTLSATNVGSYTAAATATGSYTGTNPAMTWTVTQAAAVVTLTNLSANFDGTPKAATATTNPAGKTIAITYDGSATAPTLPGSYAVVATVIDPNYSGSSTGTLVITDHGPVVTSYSSARNVLAPGAGVTLSVTAAATGSSTYQWYHDGRTIGGATAASLALNDATYADTGAYWVKISNAAGTVLSAPFFVQVAPAVTQVVAWGTDFGNVLHELAAQEDVIAVDVTLKWLVLKRDGTVARVGDRAYPVPATLSSGGVVAIASGANHLLALKADGTVVAWGQNTVGQTNVPAGLANVVAIAAGGNHSLALKNDGTVVAWGDTTSGQSAVPAGLANVVAIAADNVVSLALKSDGKLVGWGHNGNGVANVPSDLSDVVAIDAGSTFALALKSNGDVVSWDGSAGSGAAIVEGASGFAAGSTALVLWGDRLVSWGTPDWAQTNVPPSLTGVFALSTGMFNSVALRDATVSTAPVITTAPANGTQTVAGQTSFTVAATGSPTLTYRWQCWPAAGINEWADLADNSNYSGTGTATLSGQGLPLTMSGSRFRCLVTNAAGTVPSAAATLTVNRIPATFSLSANVFTYNAAAQGPTVVPTPAGATFQVVGPLSSTGVSDYSVTVIATGDYEGSNALSWSIVKATQPPPVITSASSFPYASGYGVTINPGLGFGVTVFALGTGSTAANAALDASGYATATGLGTIVVKARYAGDLNHLPSDYCADFTITILPAPTTFHLASSALTYTGYQQGPMIISTPREATFSTGGTASAVNAGSYTATASATDNYSGTNNSLIWTINKATQSAPVISSPAATILGIPYTAAANAGSGTVEWALGAGSTATGAAIDASTGALSASSPGTVVIKARFSGDQNRLASAYCTDFPVTVAPVLGVVAMSAGGRHTVFIRSDGSLWGMGDNGNGQLGDGTVIERRHPVLIASGVAAASAGGSHTLFIKADGSLWGVGNNNQGNLGDETHLERHLPVKIADNVAAISAGNGHSLFLKQDGTLWGMGQNLGGLLGQGAATANQETPVQIATGVLAVSAGDMFSAFVKNDHSLWMMGGNGSGQLGDGTLENKLVPTLIATDVASVSSGGNHTAFIKTDRSLWSMGTFYAIQAGVTTNVVTPVQVDTDVSLASADNVITLYLKPDQTLWATGSNIYGAFGDGSAPINAGAQLPHPVASGLADVSVGGNYFSLFLKSDGTLQGAGLSVHGELGTEINTHYDAAITITGGPLAAPATPGAVTVTAGSPLQTARLTWNHVIGARRYEVWRSPTNSSAAAIRVAADLTANFFEDSAVENGVYYYWIKSVGLASDSAFSAPAMVTFTNGPEINSQPSDVSVRAGQTAMFTITAAGTPPLSYQWQMGLGAVWQEMHDDTEWSGTTTPILTIADWAVSALNGVQFRCIVSNAAGSAISNAATLTARTNAADFNGNGTSDIIWQNTATGQRTLWFMNGTTYVSGVAFADVPVEWSIAGSGDFNGDGKSDIIWQNTVTGQRTIWFMNGATYVSGAAFADIPVAWSIAGSGDFNGDGKSDIIWQNTVTGERTMWLMNGITQSSGVSFGSIPVEWSIAGTGDFNGDGKSDIIWQSNTTGERTLWFMNGATYVSGVAFADIPVAWSIAGSGDFNGDGKSDLIWQNTVTGERTMWLMNGITQTSGVSFGSIPVEWSMAN